MISAWTAFRRARRQSRPLAGESGFGLPAPSACGAGRIRPARTRQVPPGQDLLLPKADFKAKLIFPLTIGGVSFRCKKGSIFVDNLQRAEIETALERDDTQSSLAEKCGITHQQMNSIIRGLRGSNLTLNMAFKSWEGVSNKLTDLISDIPSDDPLSAKIEQITNSPDEQLLQQLIDILYHRKIPSPHAHKVLKNVIESTYLEMFAG